MTAEFERGAQGFKEAGQEFDAERLREQATETVKVCHLMVSQARTSGWHVVPQLTCRPLYTSVSTSLLNCVSVVQATKVLEFLQKTCTINTTPYAGV